MRSHICWRFHFLFPGLFLSLYFEFLWIGMIHLQHFFKMLILCGVFFNVYGNKNEIILYSGLLISTRISNFWRAFWAQEFILKSNMKLKIKLKVLEMCIMSVLGYGCQSWSLTKKQVSQYSVLRSLIKDKISIEKIKAEAKIRDIGYLIKILKFRM